MAAANVLVLEDDEATAQLIKFFLKEEGCIVRIASHVKEFWNLLEEELPDLISLDIVLPDGDGFEVFEALTNKPRTKDIPVVIVTVQEHEIDKGSRMGAREFVIKPFTEGDLKKAFSAVLKSS